MKVGREESALRDSVKSAREERTRREGVKRACVETACVRARVLCGVCVCVGLLYTGFVTCSALLPVVTFATVEATV